MHNEARHCAQFEASFNEHRSQVGIIIFEK